MAYQIKKNQHVYEIQIVHKQMKRIVLRYREGRFLVSAPHAISDQKVLEWLNSLDDYAYQKLIGKKKIKMNENFVYLFSKKYPIHLYPLKANRYILKEDGLYLYQNAKMDKVLEDILMKYLKKRIATFVDEGMLSFMPEIKIQKMSSRYGVCFMKKQLVKFTLSLVHEPCACIDSIIIHELGHFYYPNHSQAFYQWVLKHDPNYHHNLAYLKNGGAGDDSVNE